jgi:hypothetical protein
VGAWRSPGAHSKAKSQQQKAAADEPRRLFINIHEEAILSLAGLATTYSSKS